MSEGSDTKKIDVFDEDNIIQTAGKSPGRLHFCNSPGRRYCFLAILLDFMPAEVFLRIMKQKQKAAVPFFEMTLSRD